ncbi:MAG TPA: di-heme oxidoredictase family protein [Terriglobales bacterium]|nr:di-heme oxidoredictase family protein [Terriglobales bacterium]
MPKRLKRFLPPLFVMAAMLTLTLMIVHAANRSRLIPGMGQTDPAPAPAAFTTVVGDSLPFNGSNGLTDICPNIDSSGHTVVPEDISAGCANNGFPEPPGDSFFLDKSIFEKQDRDFDGLGPIYNEKSCVNCHQGTVSGGWSHTAELRAGATINGTFVNPTVTINYGLNQITGRSLINALAICSDAEEVTPDQIASNGQVVTPTTTQRISLPILGDGFVEAIADSTLLGIQQQQCLSTTNTHICGEAIQVQILESPNQATFAVGRFGWKDEHASLLSFASDAYLNEMGVTNRLPPNNQEVTRVCEVTPANQIEDQPDNLGLADIDHFAVFMRGLQAPPPEDQEDIINSGQGASIARGQALFQVIGNGNGIGCANCHVPQIVTAPAGTNQGGLTPIPDALGNRVINPYSDFLLHNINTGDGIVQTPVGPQGQSYQDTAMKIRTAPLWGLHTRSRFLHNGMAYTLRQAIMAHGAPEGDVVLRNFLALTPGQQQDLINFLNSL